MITKPRPCLVEAQPGLATGLTVELLAHDRKP